MDLKAMCADAPTHLSAKEDSRKGMLLDVESDMKENVCRTQWHEGAVCATVHATWATHRPTRTVLTLPQ